MNRADQTNIAGRNVALDVLRACAVLLVIGRHMTVCPETTSRVLHRVTAVWHIGGWVGVDLFFVLSGFLVSGLLFREKLAFGTLSVKRFLIRRGFKIYPSFWLLILVTVLVNSVFGYPTPARRLASELLFVQSYVSALWGHTWTLAVEEHFYLFLCLVLAWLGGGKNAASRFRRLPGIFAVIAIGCLLSRWAVAQNPPHGFWHAFAQSHARIDSLMFGTLLSYWYHFGNPLPVLERRPVRFGLVGGGILLIAPAFVFSLDDQDWRMVVFGLPVFALGAGALILGSLHSRTLARRPFQKLARVGFYSYSIYLWHMPVHTWVTSALAAKFGPNPSWTLSWALYFFGSIGVGIVLARLVEYPVLRIRDRVFPAPRNTHLAEPAKS